MSRDISLESHLQNPGSITDSEGIKLIKLNKSMLNDNQLPDFESDCNKIKFDAIGLSIILSKGERLIELSFGNTLFYRDYNEES